MYGQIFFGTPTKRRAGLGYWNQEWKQHHPFHGLVLSDQAELENLQMLLICGGRKKKPGGQ
jgi:hypothetical protein